MFALALIAAIVALASPRHAVAQVAPVARQDFRETVQADVSTRSVAVTSGFSGTEIVVFGAVDNSRQPSAESGYYDIVIVVEGTPTELVARKKSRVAGVWLNTSSITFESVPSYYAIVSTRPLDEVADPLVLRENDIGFEYVRMKPVSGWQTGLTTGDLEDFKTSVIRLKQQEGLYLEQPLGVAFIGRSLFRASIRLPANVPVGPLVARVHLFREGRLLHTFRARVNLRREGVERLLYSFAFTYPLIYGLVTVMLSVGAGLAATELFKRATGR
ncbi:MAG: TIGR02186 family protein [Hyphomicrobiaceae bacterium]